VSTQSKGSPLTPTFIGWFVGLHAGRLQLFEKSILPTRQKRIVTSGALFRLPISMLYCEGQAEHAQRSAG
jgi:hypothetical protein